MLKLGEIMQKKVQGWFGRRLQSGYSASVSPEHLLSEGKPVVTGGG